MSVSIESTAPASPNKREEILSTAWIHFCANGFAGSSINAITREAGVSKESMYRYFSGKKNLFEAVVDSELDYYEQCVDRLTADFENEEWSCALLELAQGILEIMSSRRAIVLRKLLDQRPRLNRDHSKRLRYYACAKRIHALLESLFRGQDDTQIDPASLADYFMGLLLYRTVLERDCALRQPPDEAEVRRLARNTVADFLASFMNTDNTCMQHAPQPSARKRY
jgi:AcrR family transcriptional regulator